MKSGSRPYSLALRSFQLLVWPQSRMRAEIKRRQKGLDLEWEVTPLLKCWWDILALD